MNSLEIFRFVASKYQLTKILSGDYLTKISFYSFNADDIILISGERKPVFEEHAKKELHKNLYGIYSCNNRIEWLMNLQSNSTPHAVLLGIKDELLPNVNENPSELCEMIALHEICHYIDWQNLKDMLSISLSDCDKLMGAKLQKQAQKEADRNSKQDIDHHENFGGILYHLIREQYPNDASHKMFVALSKTLIEVENSTFWT